MTDQNSQFFAILTAVGEAKQANAAALGTSWTFAQMGVGDANGTDPIPSRTQTKLINERRRAPLNQVKVDPTNASVIIAEQIIPENVGGWWVRELALYDADGDMVAVANCAPTFKPLLSQGSGRTQVIRINLIVSSTSNIELKIDPSVVLATREYVDTSVIEALARLDFKHSVLVATTANIALSGIQTVDGVLLTADARVLVKDQAQPKDNGIYVVPAAGAWKRAQDADVSIEVTPGLFVAIEKGTANGDSVWQLVTDAPIVLGTTPLTFEVVAGRTGIVAGTYRSLTVDKLGRVIAGTNPTTLATAGITDAVSSNNDAAIVGKIADVDKCRFINGSTAAGTTDMPPVGYVAGIRAKYPGGKLAFDFVGSMTAGEAYGRTTYADGSGEWFKFWTSSNFTPSNYIPKAGGAFYPKFSGLSFNSEAGGYDSIGGYFGWGANGSGTVQIICNKGGGSVGGFLFAHSDAAGNLTNPMRYTPAGRLEIAAELYVPAITSNTTVPTQSQGYAGSYIANCAYVVAAVQYKINGNACSEAGFIGGDAAIPYMKNTNGTVVRLQVDRPKDTALLEPAGWSKNADTGEIHQWLEIDAGDIPTTKSLTVAWQFQFPNAITNVQINLRKTNTSTACVQGYYRNPTRDGCIVDIEEWSGVVQSGVVICVEARGK